MLQQRLSLVTIGAYDLPNLRTFYRNLGWQETEWSSDDYTVFTNAGSFMSLWPIHELAKDSGLPVPSAPPTFRGVSLAVNVDTRELVDESLATAEQAGGKILKHAHDAFWGGRVGLFLDPENNLWEVAFNPNSRFDERGTMIEMNG